MSSVCIPPGEGTMSLPAVTGTEPRAQLHAGPPVLPATEAAHRPACRQQQWLCLAAGPHSPVRGGISQPCWVPRGEWLCPRVVGKGRNAQEGSSGPSCAGVTLQHRDSIGFILKTWWVRSRASPAESLALGRQRDGPAWGAAGREGGDGAPTPAGWQGKAEPGLGESEPGSSPQPENMNNSANICGAGVGEPSQGSSRPLAGRS